MEPIWTKGGSKLTQNYKCTLKNKEFLEQLMLSGHYSQKVYKIAFGHDLPDFGSLYLFCLHGNKAIFRMQSVRRSAVALDLKAPQFVLKSFWLFCPVLAHCGICTHFGQFRSVSIQFCYCLFSFTFVSYHLLPFAVICYCSLSLAIIHYHLLSFAIICYHSLSFTLSHYCSLSFAIVRYCCSIVIFYI